MISIAILNILLFIFSLMIKVSLHIAKISLLMLQVPVDFTAKKALKEFKKNRSRDKQSILIQSSTLLSYVTLKSLIATLTVLVWVLDVIITLITVFGIFIGLAVFIMMVAAITAGAYIIILNNCSVGNSQTQTSATNGEKSSSNENIKRGNSTSAGMGEFTQEAKDWAKDWDVTYIGDSLGVGAESTFKSYFTKAEYHSDGSRGLVSLKGMTTGTSGIEILEQLVKDDKVKENLVVALGTNNDMNLDNMKAFYEKIPSSVKTITWVLTASEGPVDNESINKTIKEFVEAHDNMRYLDFKTFVSKNGGWSSFAGGDSIHMTTEGYKKYAEFQVQGLYDLYGGGNSSDSANAKEEEKDSPEEKKDEQAQGIDFFGSAYRLANRTIKKANNMYVLAKESEEDDSSDENDSDENSSSDSSSSSDNSSTEEKKSESRHGCNYSTKKVESGSDSKSSNSSGSYSGEVGYLYKVPFSITQGYGATNFAATGAYAAFENGWHSGFDFAGPDKTEILSATDGEVFETIDDLSIGYIVVIKIPDGFLMYEHLLEPASTYVKKGDKVKVGQVLGKQAGSANGSVYAFGSHLHFQYNPGSTWTLQSLSHGSKPPTDYIKGLPHIEEDKVSGPYYEQNPTTITPE